ncbi:hypothetical protein ACJ5H2_22920 (plasmid) [Nocardioides sp. R1-1]|uniref:hypothetical protein n=1 Tax=Nocardioides sp. R1-1 TaxID=3383502 RepID=UPI0038D0014B
MPIATPADDLFHEVESDDPFWTETAWFAFSVPERRLTGMSHPLFRLNQGICSSGVYVWDDTGESDHEVLYSQNFWHLPLPTDDKHIKLLNGLEYDVLEPLRRYRVRYDGGLVKFDLEYEGICEPVMNEAGNHLDQPCRVTGTLELRGESIKVDCFDIRDKTWHVRSDVNMNAALAQGSYTYAITADSAVMTWMSGDPTAEQKLLSGWLLRDGKVSEFSTISRRTTRDSRRLLSGIELEGRDGLGREFRLSGKTLNRYAFRAAPSLPCWISAVDYSLDGVPAQGQTQEWSMQLFNSTRSENG